ncbi:unnamed protein product [Microthlaspi erraticum]|uniref:F-box domain-containing protein n=1 Tax=Microthlaspi erraticum TaxID=1685480 RepID=A0A6D2II14_9BRAS|nr:unnamed protein product [Microthlaspi erraticum]
MSSSMFYTDLVSERKANDEQERSSRVLSYKPGKDRISSLPDHLLCQILSLLPTKKAVGTSVLSKRWQSLWLSVPLVDLNISDLFIHHEKDMVSFVHGFLDHVSKESSWLLKLKLSVSVNNEIDQSCVTSWIDCAVLHKVQHLDINRHRFYPFVPDLLIPLSLYTCETLVCLKLTAVSFPGFEHVSLPRLKIMHLEYNRYSSDALLERLVSSCPLLEDLKVARYVETDSYTVTVLRVRSQSLKSLALVLSGHDPWCEDDWEVVMDAPRLDYLRLKDEQSGSFLISNLRSSVKVDIDVSGIVSSNSDVMRKFFTVLSNVRDMTLSRATSVELGEFKKKEQLLLSLSSVPTCLRSSLEYVEIKTAIRGADAEMKLVKYLLENSAVLKKFWLRLSCRSLQEESVTFIQLMRFRRCSASCEVVVELEGAYPTMIQTFW